MKQVVKERSRKPTVTVSLHLEFEKKIITYCGAITCVNKTMRPERRRRKEMRKH